MNKNFCNVKQYIDKSAVVAEINRVLASYDPNEITSGRYALVNLYNFLDTLEVKEVDLEKEHKDMDEKIRQYLLWLVKPLWEDTINNIGLKKDDIIAWIEKKGK